MKYITITTTVLKLLHHRASASNADYNNIIPQPAGSPDTPINVIAKNYTDDDGTLLQGFLSLPRSLSSSSTNNDNSDTNKKYPAVIILHDSDGPNEYEKQRASILSSQNDYVGFAADMFGYYTEIPDPSAEWGSSQSLTQQFSTNTTLFVQRIQAAVEYVQSLDQVDETKVAIIGYCFGGTGVVHYLNEMGSKEEEGSIVPLAGAIGVHPSLVEWSGPEGNINIPSLFLTGGNDFLTGPEAMRKLESDLEEGNALWEMVRYSKINHAFSRWYGENYDARVDARSWHYAMNYLDEMFGLCTALVDCGGDTLMSNEDVNFVNSIEGKYTDELDGAELTGRLSYPEDMADDDLIPVVIILATDANVSGMEALKVNDLGYIAFEADSSNLETNDNAQEMTIRSAINYVKGVEGVDPDKIAVMGIGGAGGAKAMYYAMAGEVDPAVKAITISNGLLSLVANSTMVTEALSMSDESSAGGWGGAGGGGWGDGDAGGSTTSGGWGSGDTGGSSEWGGEGPSGEEWSQEEDVEEEELTSPTWGNDNNNRRQETISATSKPQVLIQSSAAREDMEDVINIEKAMIAKDMNYEITRYSTVTPGYDRGVWDRDQVSTLLAEIFSDDYNTSNEEPYDEGLETNDSGENLDSGTTTEPNDESALSSASYVSATLLSVFILTMTVSFTL